MASNNTNRIELTQSQKEFIAGCADSTLEWFGPGDYVVDWNCIASSFTSRFGIPITASQCRDVDREADDWYNHNLTEAQQQWIVTACASDRLRNGQADFTRVARRFENEFGISTTARICKRVEIYMLITNGIGRISSW